MTITLRQAVASDAAAIRALTREAYADWVPLIGREPLPMTVDYEDAVRRHRFDLLCRDGDLVGLIETVAETDHLLIENVAVLPAAQGQGLGRRLLAHAEALVVSLGFGEVRLSRIGNAMTQLAPGEIKIELSPKNGRWIVVVAIHQITVVVGFTAVASVVVAAAA